MTNREELEKEMNELVYDAGDGHPFARQMMDRVAEIHKILYPESIAKMYDEDPIIQEAFESGQVVEMSFDELFGVK